ncbi:MAG TPA: hypothetical protein VIZ65_14320 [Cellvibrionaceae bacterium]
MQTVDAQYLSNEERREAVVARDAIGSRDALVSKVPSLSAVSWGAILAGAAAAAALSLILLFLGVGLGLSSVSPWAHSGVSGTTFSVATIVWITLTSLAASAIGGYLAGRLRTRWISTHVDEVHFRDTAHGFLAWAIATLITAMLLTSAVSSIIGGAAQTGAALVGSGVVSTAAVATEVGTSTDSNADINKSMPYLMDKLLRKEPSTAALPNPAEGVIITNPSSPQTDAAKAELTAIFTNALLTGKLPAEDTRYAAQLIGQNTNLSAPEAEKRVTDAFNIAQTKLREAETAAKNAADEARKASAYGSLWLFISLLGGAFVASLTAVYGGRQRDL